MPRYVLKILKVGLVTVSWIPIARAIPFMKVGRAIRGSHGSQSPDCKSTCDAAWAVNRIPVRSTSTASGCHDMICGVFIRLSYIGNGLGTIEQFDLACAANLAKRL